VPERLLAAIIDLVRLTLSADAAPEQLAGARATLAAAGLDAPLRILAARLGLGDGELRVVCLLAALALDPDVRRLAPTEPTLDTLRRLAYGAQPSRAALRDLAADAPLRALHVIERSDGAADVHEHRQTWVLAPRVLALLHGEVALDPDLAGVVRIPPAGPELSALAVAGEVAMQARRAVAQDGIAVVAVGASGLGRRSLLVAAARAEGRELLEIDAARLAGSALANQLGRIARECRLLDRAPLVVGLDVLATVCGALAPVRDALAPVRDAVAPIRDVAADAVDRVGSVLCKHAPGVVLATATAAVLPRWPRPVVRVELGSPTSAQRAALWSAALDAPAERGDALARRYRLAPAVIGRVAAASRAAGSHGADAGSCDAAIATAVRGVVDNSLGRLARRRPTPHTLADLVVPRDHAEALVELVARLRARDRVLDDWGLGAKLGAGGVAALFSGPPGTGKSMCAGAVAAELGVDLYTVDTAAITSKWLGETEQHLGQLFDAAAAAHAMLLFDECDALFGKRTEQRSSNDRHANAETNYLLHRLERHDAPCVLTTNHPANLDPAFIRRLALHLKFAPPDAADREALWRSMLPANGPIAGDVDVAALARRFELAGGHIRNAVLRAAYVAADRGAAIDHALLERAALAEYTALGRVAVATRRAH
jgi:hypothetical protein